MAGARFPQTVRNVRRFRVADKERFPQMSSENHPVAIRVDTIGKQVIIAIVGKIGKSLRDTALANRLRRLRLRFFGTRGG